MQSSPAAFLCPRHREWLRDRPSQALAFWHSAMEQAQRQICRGEWAKAWRHAGCAYEAARLMVQDARHCDREWVRRHSASVALLQLAGGQRARPDTVTVH